MRPAELDDRIDHHRTGPEQDRAARLAVCSLMADQPREEIATILDALALLPGQEDKRAAANLSIPQMQGKEKACRPTKREIAYVPN